MEQKNTTASLLSDFSIDLWVNVVNGFQMPEARGKSLKLPVHDKGKKRLGAHLTLPNLTAVYQVMPELETDQVI